MNYQNKLVLVALSFLFCLFFSCSICFATDIDSINLGQSKYSVEKTLNQDCRFLQEDSNGKRWYQWVEDNYIAVCYNSKGYLTQVERFFPVSSLEEAKEMLIQGIADYREYFQQDPSPWDTKYLQDAVIWDLGKDRYYYLGISQDKENIYMVQGKYSTN